MFTISVDFTYGAELHQRFTLECDFRDQSVPRKGDVISLGAGLGALRDDVEVWGARFDTFKGTWFVRAAEVECCSREEAWGAASVLADHGWTVSEPAEEPELIDAEP